MRFGEQAAEPGFVLRRTIEGRHERLPLLFVENKSRLVGQCLFRALAGTAQDEVCDVHALALSRCFNEGFFRGVRAKLEPAVWVVRELKWPFGAPLFIELTSYSNEEPAARVLRQRNK